MKRNQALASLQAFLPDDKEIVRIINLCGLDPTTSDSWREWSNQYSPFIKVQKNKKLVTRWKGEDFFTPKKDLYAYSSAKDVASMSKALFFIAEEDCFCFLFLGKDDKLRYRRYLKEMYLNNPPLHVPIEDIRTFIKHEKIEGHTKIEPSVHRNKGQKTIGWVTSWPPTKSFYQDITKETTLCQNQIIVNELFKD